MWTEGLASTLLFALCNVWFQKYILIWWIIAFFMLYCCYLTLGYFKIETDFQALSTHWIYFPKLCRSTVVGHFLFIFFRFEVRNNV